MYLLEKLQNQYGYLLNMLSGLEEDFIYRRFKEGKWSIHENLAHLGRYHEIFGIRIERIVLEQNPRFLRYSANEDPAFEAWCQRQNQEIITQTQMSRKAITDKLWALDEATFKRTGFHPKLGKMNLIHWIEFFLLHESHHIYTIFGQIHSNKDTWGKEI